MALVITKMDIRYVICSLTFYVIAITGPRLATCQVNPAPSHSAGQVGSDVTLMCGYTGPQIFHWKEFISTPFGESVFTTPASQPEDTTKYAIDGQYNLVVKSLRLDSGGMYGCVETSMSEPATADLIVLEPPSINIPDLIEGATTSVTCMARYGGPEEPASQIDLRVHLDGVLQNHPATHVVAAKPGPGTEYVYGEYRVTYNYTAINGDDGKNMTCEIWTSGPQFSVTSSMVLQVKYPVRNLEIHPRQPTYFVGDEINCTADGNPSPSFMWRPITSSGAVTISGNVLEITENMGGYNEWRCQATNTVQNTETIEEIIEFEVDTSQGPTGKATTLYVCPLLWLLALLTVVVMET